MKDFDVLNNKYVENEWRINQKLRLPLITANHNNSKQMGMTHNI